MRKQLGFDLRIKIFLSSWIVFLCDYNEQWLTWHQNYCVDQYPFY